MLHLDYTNVLEERVGEHGLNPSALHHATPRLVELTERLNASRGSGWEAWRSLPFDPLRHEHVDHVMQLVDRLHDRCENLIVLGIGGSALGNIALQNALNPLTWNLLPRETPRPGPDRSSQAADENPKSGLQNSESVRTGPRLFVLDNIDPQFVAHTLAEVQRHDPKLERTFVNVISKSGETAETASQFLILRDMLKQTQGPTYQEHIIATTDPSRGTMRAICDAEGYATLPIPEGVGGRFSVLSPVGLFSAAMCGIDIEQLLAGAAEMDLQCQVEEPHNNPAAVLSWLLVEYIRRGKTNHVLMPYCNALYSLADWYRQLWAESLGKKFDLDGREVCIGATPIKALGATDQHSQVQLYREGPNDKVIGFIEVADFGCDVPIPAGPSGGPPEALDVEALHYLQSRTLGELLRAEMRATQFALVESQRPNFTLVMPKLNAYFVGQFLQLWMVTTAFAGQMLHINPYDQPAVETGKIATFGLMGRAGYEEWRQRVESLDAHAAAVVPPSAAHART